MLTEKPTCCPICNGEWIKNLILPESSHQRYTCINWKICNLELIIMRGDFFLVKTFNNGGEVWWCGNGPSEMRLAQDGFKKLTFDPPFDIDEDRLKLLIIFS